jgi:hypothetical protein
MHSRTQGIVSAGTAVVVVIGLWLWLAARSGWRPESWRPFLAIGCAGVLVVVVYRAMTRGFRG